MDRPWISPPPLRIKGQQTQPKTPHGAADRFVERLLPARCLMRVFSPDRQALFSLHPSGAWSAADNTSSASGTGWGLPVTPSFVLAAGLVLVLATATEPAAAEPAAPQAATRPSYRVLAQDKGHVAIINPQGGVDWEVECKHNSHDIARLANGNLLLHTGPAQIVEMTPAKEIVWQYEAKPTTESGGKVEIHAFQRLPDGLTLVAESGNRRLVEVDAAGQIVKQVPLVIEHPHPHRDTRLARKLASGNYLVCHEGDGKVREYDPAGKVIWSYTLDLAGRPRSPGHGPEAHGTEVFAALRLVSGNTLIACGNGNRVIEVTPAGKTVWSIEQNELPGIQLAWVTTLEVLPSGNIIFGNTHAGEANPQLIEVNRDKKVVWTFRDFEHFGNSLAAAMVLDVAGVVR
jgi:hypothetical protein